MQVFCRTYLCTKSSIIFEIKKWIFLFFTIVKLAAVNEDIDRVDKLAAGFQQAPLVQSFWNFHLKHIGN